jgi:hypothetical protein
MFLLFLAVFAFFFLWMVSDVVLTIIAFMHGEIVMALWCYSHGICCAAISLIMASASICFFDNFITMRMLDE